MQDSFWRWLLICYGRSMYDLPREVGLPLPPGKKEYNFPSFSLEKSMSVGISPLELYSYPTMSGFRAKYTPIHIATALLVYGQEAEREVAHQMLRPAFLRAAYREHAAATFVQYSIVNPHPPARFGLPEFTAEDLFDGIRLLAVDDLGNAAWFDDTYLKQILCTVPSVQWYLRLGELHRLFGRWEGSLRSTAASLIRGQQTHNKGYEGRLRYLRDLLPGDARAFLKQESGVIEVLWMSRADSTPAEMAKGLRVLSTSTSGNISPLWCYIGRELTYEDFKQLTPRQALTVLHRAPAGAVKTCITEHQADLAAMFFALNTKDHLTTIVNSMDLTHVGRPEIWQPDVPETQFMDLHSGKDHAARWAQVMHPLIQVYLRNKAWRDQYQQLADPATLFLAMMHAKAERAVSGKFDAPVPFSTLSNVLRSHPNIQEIQKHLTEMPTDIPSDAAL